MKKAEKYFFQRNPRVLFQNLRRGRTFWASVGNQLLRDGKKSQFDFVSILSAGAEQGPAASLHNRRGGRWGLLRLNPSHATHAPSVQPSLVRHLTQPPCFLLACPKFTWTVEVSDGRQACKRTYGRLRKRKSRMLPLFVCSLPVFPTSYAMKASIEACFALFFCVRRHATPWNIGWQAAISVRWLKLAHPLSVCNTVYMRRLCGITWYSFWSQKVSFTTLFIDIVFVVINEL